MTFTQGIAVSQTTGVLFFCSMMSQGQLQTFQWVQQCAGDNTGCATLKQRIVKALATLCSTSIIDRGNVIVLATRMAFILFLQTVGL